MGCSNAKRRLACLLELGLFILGALPASAQTPASGANSYMLNVARSKIQFTISHFVVSSTDGQFTKFDGKLTFQQQATERGSVTVHVSTGSIDTGIAARDEHLRTPDFFDVAHFPLATFESTSLTTTDGRTGTLNGVLTLHGVSRPIVLKATLQSPDQTGDRLIFAVKGTLMRSDYGMRDYLSVIGDEVTLDINAEFDRTH